MTDEKLKLMVIGHGRHGKDEVGYIISNTYGYTFISSSLFCAERLIFPMSQVKGSALPRYRDMYTCFRDRHNQRAVWYEAINSYNKSDPAKLGREIYNQYDLYCGLRNKREFHALKNSKTFDVSIWVDRSDHVEPEDEDSCTVKQWMADYTIDNNGSLEDLELNVTTLMRRLHNGKG